MKMLFLLQTCAERSIDSRADNYGKDKLTFVTTAIVNSLCLYGKLDSGKCGFLSALFVCLLGLFGLG